MSTISQKHHGHTKRVLIISLTSLMLFPLFTVTSLVVVQGELGDTTYSIKSTVTYINLNEESRTWNLSEEDRTVSLFMNNSWQSVELKDTTFPFEALKTDTDGNNITVLKFPKEQLLPGESVSYTIEYRVVSRPRAIPNVSEEESGTLEDIPHDLKENYTRAEGPWLVKDPSLVGLAHEIAGNETKILSIIKGFVGWINKNINYITHELPLYPNETLFAREGDCDDQAILLITLARIMGIPAHLQIGTIYMPEHALIEETYWNDHVRAIQRKIGWHGWAMVYVPPWGWLPVDLTYVSVGFSSDPLNAIRYGAVTLQKTIQYMNFSKTDHVAESRQAKSFILENGFFVDLKDEMTEIEQDNLLVRLDPWVAIALGTATVMVLVSSFLISRRWRRHIEKQGSAPSE